MKFQKILITGGSRGIGRSFVDLFLKDNCEVHVVSRNFKNKPENSNLLFHSFDLSKTKDICQFCEDFILNHGVPDLLINNAGSGAFYEWNQFPENEIHNQINLLFFSPVLICRTFAPAMAEAGKGKIINISSIATLYPLPYMPLYNAGKSALSSFTRSMILEYEKYPKFMDLLVGDVNTDFNIRVSKRDTALRKSRKMDSAWIQIEKQLFESPNPKVVASRILKKIEKPSSSVNYEGSFSHRILFPLFCRFLPEFFKNKILQIRYFR